MFCQRQFVKIYARSREYWKSFVAAAKLIQIRPGSSSLRREAEALLELRRCLDTMTNLYAERLQQFGDRLVRGSDLEGAGVRVEVMDSPEGPVIQLQMRL